jgi:hypothetical protein
MTQKGLGKGSRTGWGLSFAGIAFAGSTRAA